MKVALTSGLELREGDSRLDASYHASTGVQALNFLRQWSRPLVEPQVRGQGVLGEPQPRYLQRRVDALSEVCMPGGIFIPGRFKRVYVDDPEHGEPWLSPSEMQRSDLNNLRFASRKYTPAIDSLRIHKGYILLSRSGTIGNLVYVRQDMDDLVGSDDIIRIIPDPSKAPPGYVHTFLSSTLGRALIEQKTYGAVVPHIEAHHVIDLPIPRLDPAVELRVHDLVERAAELKTQANHLLAAAQAELFKTCSLPRLSNREALTKGSWCFVVPRKLFGEFALTAWTYNPIAQRIIADIESKKHSFLSELVNAPGIYYGHQFKRIDADPSIGIMLLSQAHVFQERPAGRWISKNSVRDHIDYMVSGGTILVAAQGTMGDNELFGHSQFVHRNFENRMITQHILRIVPASAKVNPGYLFAYLSSEYGFQLLRSNECGTKLLGFIIGLVARLPVPMVEKSLQDEIGAMVYRSYDYRADALQFEDQAQTLLAQALTEESTP